MMTTTMTNEEIIRMAREAGIRDVRIEVSNGQLERFANLVEQRVRSEIALEELAKQAQKQGEYK